jgi:hypothetical protein
VWFTCSPWSRLARVGCGTRRVFGSSARTQSPTYSPTDVLWADYTPAGTIRFGFGIRNATLVPVTVTDLPPWNNRFIVRQVPVGHDERGSSFDTRPLPITLAPGQMTILVVAAQFQNCQFWLAGGATGFESMSVDVTVLAVPRQVNFRLPFQVRLKTADACP